MKRENISSCSPFEASIGFSRACRIGQFLSVAGTAPLSADGTTASPGDVYAQTKRCLEISKTALEAAGGSLEGVIRTRIMLTDISRWQEAGRAHGEYFGNIRPACTFMEVSRFIDAEWLVETEVDCIVDCSVDCTVK